MVTISQKIKTQIENDFILVEKGEGFGGNTEDSVTLDLFRALIYMVAIWMYEKLLRYLWFVNSFIYILIFIMSYNINIINTQYFDENENYTFFNFCISVIFFIFLGSNLIQWKGNIIEHRDQRSVLLFV